MLFLKFGFLPYLLLAMFAFRRAYWCSGTELRLMGP